MSDPKPEKVPAAKKSGGGKVGIIMVAVFVCVSSTAGAVFGQVALARMKPAEKEKVDSGYEEKEEPLAAETMIPEPIIVDLRNEQGEIHHIKVGFAIELAKPVPEEEQKKLMVRAKDAAITYLRTLSYDDATTQDKFEGIKKELGERISKALGRGRVAHVLFTEFVVQ